MEWKTTWNDPLTRYLAPFHDLIGDKRTRRTFDETIRGIMGAGSLICQQIAAHSAVLAKVKKGAQRILRLAGGESTQRSELDAQQLTKKLREAAVEYLEQAPEEELWLVADCSDLRKPYATEMPYLMQVPALEGKGLVPGYRTLNVLGITPGRRGILYHRLLSSQAPGFVSEPAEVQEALATVSQALRPLKAHKTVTWITDRGFDDVAVWRTIWDQHEHLVCRIYHTERAVALQDKHGNWIQGNLAQAEVQVLDWRALQTLVALAWVTAGFLYQMGVTFQWAEVQLLAKLGGWEPHKDRKPGKITLMRGLSRLVEMLATQAVLSRYASEHQGLPPNITAFLQGWSPPSEL